MEGAHLARFQLLIPALKSGRSARHFVRWQTGRMYTANNLFWHPGDRSGMPAYASYQPGSLYLQDAACGALKRESAAGPRSQTRFQTLKKNVPGHITWRHDPRDVTSLYPTTLKHGGWSEQPISVRPTSCMRAVFERRQIVQFRGTLEAGNQRGASQIRHYHSFANGSFPRGQAETVTLCSASRPYTRRR